MAHPHVTRANKYARDVVAGKIPAGKYVRSACQRHLDDLKRAEKKVYPYRFDPEAGESICAFTELLPHTKGKWAAKRETIVLQPWQCFLLAVSFGWKVKKSGLRRFRELYFEIPRKNGKSIIGAAIALYMFTADGEFGAEVYTGAGTEKQAWEVFRPAKLMVERTPDLREAAGIDVWAKALIIESDGSKFEPVIGKPGDGSSPSCAVIDEFHEHDTPDLINTMQTGMGAREQPLTAIITTAGFNLASPCYDKSTELKRVLDGVIENDELFGVIFSIDEGDDWADPKVLRKANPNYGVSVFDEFLLAQQRDAIRNPVKQNRFKTKHLNVWCAARAAWMSMQVWHACGDETLRPEDFAGCECYFSLDLASKSDLLAFNMTFVKEIEGRKHFFVFGRYYLPEDALEEAGANQAAYQKWHAEGFLTLTDGATTDFDTVKDDVVEAARMFNPKEVVFDPFNAMHMAQQLMDEGLTLVEFTQTPANFAVPMDEILTAAKDGRLHHDKHPMLDWMVANTAVRPAKKGLVAPMKEKPDQKIDGTVAMMMSVARACATDNHLMTLPDGYSMTTV